MNLLCESQALAHDEGICQENKGPHPNLGVRENGVTPEGNHHFK